MDLARIGCAVIGLLLGFIIGYRWCWWRYSNRVQDLLEGMRIQQRMHEAEKEQWMRCAVPPLPMHAPDEFGA